MKIRRGGEPIDVGPSSARNWFRTLPFETCNKRGHAMTPENTIEYPDGRKQCRECHQQAQRKRVECPICGLSIRADHRARHIERAHRR